MAGQSVRTDHHPVTWFQDTVIQSRLDVRSAADRGNPDARLALDVHAHRLRSGIAAMAAALGGLDTLVFTGGIGEHQGEVRAEAAAGLGFLGVTVDEGRNAAARPDCDISAQGAAVRTLVIIFPLREIDEPPSADLAQPDVERPFAIRTNRLWCGVNTWSILVTQSFCFSCSGGAYV